MAVITGKPNLFFVTSPRSPHKMKDEIKLLIDKHEGEVWDSQTQTAFTKDLSETGFFEGTLGNNADFKARDRINRGPKALGFVDLSPIIKLTEPGRSYLYGRRPHEAFTRQLLKFQFSSPYHIDKEGSFAVRPYLELLRLVYELETLSKDELALFAIQLVHFTKYRIVKDKILKFRKDITEIDRRKMNYKRLVASYFASELAQLYSVEIAQNNFATRQSETNNLSSFIDKKRRNHLDYADAAIRYLRETRLVSLQNSRSNRVRIPSERLNEVEFILDHTPREPIIFDSMSSFKDYLFDPLSPTLLSDDKPALVQSITNIFQNISINELKLLDVEQLKNIREDIIEKRKEDEIVKQIELIKSYGLYSDIVESYNDIKRGGVIDAPAMMEWNTWRAFTMLDDGIIQGNFNFDDSGFPLSSAPGGKPDILCFYTDFDILVEVTLSTGAKQFEMEGEPVARHVGVHRKSSKKDVYCIFIANTVNDNTIAYFFSLHKVNIAYYGGKARIIPLSLSQFLTILEKAYISENKPTAQTIEKFVQEVCVYADSADDEVAWRQGIEEAIRNWG